MRHSLSIRLIRPALACRLPCHRRNLAPSVKRLSGIHLSVVNAPHIPLVGLLQELYYEEQYHQTAHRREIQCPPVSIYQYGCENIVMEQKHKEIKSEAFPHAKYFIPIELHVGILLHPDVHTEYGRQEKSQPENKVGKVFFVIT